MNVSEQVTEQAGDANEFSASLEHLRRSAENLSIAIDKTIVAVGGQQVPVAPDARQLATLFLNKVIATGDGLRDVDRQFELLQKLVETTTLLTSSLDLEQVLKEFIDIIV